jgi:uncharacterized protein YjbI with pentapeptide repeats
MLVPLCFLSFTLGQVKSPTPGQPPATSQPPLSSKTSSGNKFEDNDSRRANYFKATDIQAEAANQDVSLSDGVVQGELTLRYDEEKSLTFRNVIFENDLNIDGIFGSINFDHCRFNRNVRLYVVRSPNLIIRSSEFLGSVTFNVDVTGFTLFECDFAKSVNLYGAKFGKTKGNAINITRITSKEPIQISWEQFGEKWLQDLISSRNLGDPEARESNIRHILTELEFWRDNFSRLGHKRDATEVLYQINEYVRVWVPELQPSRLERYAGLLLKWPSRFGTRPFRPLWLALVVICFFAVIYWIKDPFTEKDKTKPPTKPRRPLAIFALMYSIDTFVPAIDISRVREWGWELTPSYRWVAVAERLVGLLIVYAAAYSLTYYVL